MKNSEKQATHPQERQVQPLPVNAPKKRFRVEKLEERIAPKASNAGAKTSSGTVGVFYSIY